MRRWIKKHPLAFFLLLSLSLHLLALIASSFSGWKQTSFPGGVIECEYYQLKAAGLENAPFSPPSPEEFEIEKGGDDEVSEEVSPPLSLAPATFSSIPAPSSDSRKVGDNLSPLPSPTGEETLTDYVAHLEEQIAAQIHYPELAARMRLEGSVVVSFTLGSSGSLQSLFIPPGGESAFAPFNQEALRAVWMASDRFQAFPPALPQKNLTFRLPVSFR